MKKIINILLLIYFCTSLQCFAVSKYSQEFIRHFSVCKNYKETKYNTAYNSHDTYEIKGYAPDGSGRCIYVETNEWQRGKYVTTCMFTPKEQEEYFRAMLNPDVKTSVLIKGMAFVDANEKAVYLKYYNNPKVCQSVKY